MRLRKGKIKNILEASIDAALLAVEVYNKPRTTFRCQNYVSLMVVAWTYLFHAYFQKTIGNKYYHKKNNGRYEIIDDERKAWELKTCINRYGKLREPIKANLEFFINLRNKVEHRILEKRELDTVIFGECQSLLYNYENTLIELFGEKFALNEHLVYSLQFSTRRTSEQNQANKRALSKEVISIFEYIKRYRDGLSDEVFNSQEYSIKLIQIPKVSNTNRNDFAIEFVKWDELSEDDKEKMNKITTIIKDKLVVKEAINVKRFKPGEVVREVNKILDDKISLFCHLYLCKVFNIRPSRNSLKDPFDTNTKYCHFDALHKDYVYEQEWINFIVYAFQSKKLSRARLRRFNRDNRKINIDEFIKVPFIL